MLLRGNTEITDLRLARCDRLGDRDMRHTDMELDRELIRQARALINGATVHRVGGWILAYEVYPPGSPRSQLLESLLRHFVSRQERSKVMRNHIKVQRNVVDELRSKRVALDRLIQLNSAALKRRIQKLLTSTSD